jgi:hypothetical protein
VHDPLKLGAIQQVVGYFFAGKHFQRDAPRGCGHSGGFVGGHVTGGDGFQRLINDDSQAAHLTALIVDFFWRRNVLRRFRHEPWSIHAKSMDPSSDGVQ